MRAVDTNVLVRIIARDDPQQTAAADAFIAKGAWVSHLALVESVWVLTSFYRRSAAEIAATVEELLRHESLVVQEPDIVIAALARFAKRGAPGFADCMMLEVARKAGHLPLATFDRTLAKLPDAAQI